MDAHAAGGVVVFDAGDFGFGEDPLLPGGFVGVFDSLEVHVVVNCFDEFEAYDAVVGCFFDGDAALALFGGHFVEFVHAFGVEDLVDAGGG